MLAFLSEKALRKLTTTMFKNSPLPADCPPLDAAEPSEPTLFYRLVFGEKINERSFQPYVQLYPENKRYRNLCVAYSVSLFSTLGFTMASHREAMLRNKILGDHVAVLKILPEHGKFDLNPLTGHCSFWFYESCDFTKIECTQIIPIDANS